MKRLQSVALAALALVITAAFALPPITASAQSSASLSIVPKKNYTIEPGKAINDTLIIRNLDSEVELQLTLRVVDFTFTDDGGTPKLFLDENAPQTTWSLKPYLTVPQTVTIPPSSSETLDMSVAIPANQGAGSFYSAIVYSSGASDGGNVGLSASGVTLVFTNIPGEVDEELRLEKFGAYREAEGEAEAKYLFATMKQPRQMAFTLENRGNVTEAPVGSITVKDMFGRERMITNVNPNNSLALIGQTRTFVSCIELDTQQLDFNGSTANATTCDAPGLWPGRYTASLDLFYGQNGNRTQEIHGSASFWYLPVWFIVVLVILLAAIAYAVWRIVRFVRKLMYGDPKKPYRRR